MKLTDPTLLLDPKPDQPPASYGSGESLQGDIRLNRIEVITTADDKVNVTEPSSPSHPQSPYNHVYQSISGHLTEIDDTPGAERLNRQHKSGTFEEIHPDGTRVIKVFGKDYYLILDDHTLFVGGNLNISVQGNANILVAGDLKTKVSGDVDQTIHGNFTQRVSGTTTYYGVGDINIQGENEVNLHADDSIQINSNEKVTVSSPETIIIGYDSLALSGENVTCSGLGNMTFNNGQASIGIQGNTATMSAPIVNIRAAEQLTSWTDQYYYGNPGASSNPVPPPNNAPTPGVQTDNTPESLDPGPGLEVSESIIYPSVSSQLATRSDNAAMIQTLDTPSYPKDRQTFTDE